MYAWSSVLVHRRSGYHGAFPVPVSHLAQPPSWLAPPDGQAAVIRPSEKLQVAPGAFPRVSLGEPGSSAGPVWAFIWDSICPEGIFCPASWSLFARAFLPLALPRGWVQEVGGAGTLPGVSEVTGADRGHLLVARIKVGWAGVQESGNLTARSWKAPGSQQAAD